MNLLTTIQSSIIPTTAPGPQSEPSRAEKPVREKVRQIEEVEFVPADLSDLEFQAQQQAEENDKRRGQTRESNAFLQTQDLPDQSNLGRFIDIQV